MPDTHMERRGIEPRFAECDSANGSEPASPKNAMPGIETDRAFEGNDSASAAHPLNPASFEVLRRGTMPRCGSSSRTAQAVAHG